MESIEPAYAWTARPMGARVDLADLADQDVVDAILRVPGFPSHSGPAPGTS
jgi:hypothetical protein